MLRDAAVRRRWFDATRSRAVKTGLGVAAGSLLALLIAGALPPEPWGQLISGVASTTLTIGAVTVVYDVLFRAQFAAELLEVVGLEKALHDAGIRSISNEADIAWQAVFARVSTVDVVLTKPLSWVEREWQHVVAAAQTQKTRVTVYVPEPTAASFHILADQVALTSAELEAEVDAAQRAMVERWNDAETSNFLVKGSSLEVYRYPAMVAMSLVVCDDRSWLIVPALMRKNIAQGAPAIEARDESAATLWNWATKQVDAARKAAGPPAESKEVK